jgi:membrane-bound lytic murein transglycosylase D
MKKSSIQARIHTLSERRSERGNMCSKFNLGRRIRFIFIQLACLAIGRLSAGDSPSAFPIPPELNQNVQFWIDVYTKYSKDQAIIHDMDNPLRIYAVVDLKAFNNLPEKRRDKLVEDQKKCIITIIKKLEEKNWNASELTEGELKIFELFGENHKPEVFQKAAERVRSQTGLRESFMEGVVRSGKYLSEIRKVFKRYGLPEELVYLPHVESSYNVRAVSKAGAVGVWQFTKSTGKLFLTVTDELDERKDPLLAAEAAAKLLRHNYKVTGNWPLAVTAYNHGLLSIRKAMSELNTDDLMRIILYYEQKPFGFASKNFYAEFLAAVRVAENPSAYFGDLPYDPPLVFKTADLPLVLNIDVVGSAFRTNADTLKELNPAFKQPILKGKKGIPKGYKLRLPAETDITAAYETLTSQGYLPRGAYRAWCEGAEKELFQFIEQTGKDDHAFGPHT